MPDLNVLISFYGMIAVAFWLNAKPKSVTEKLETGFAIFFILVIIMGVSWFLT